MRDYVEIVRGGLDFVGVAIAAALCHGHDAACAELAEGCEGTALLLIGAFGLGDGEQVVLHSDNVNCCDRRSHPGSRRLRQFVFVDRPADRERDQKTGQAAYASHTELWHFWGRDLAWTRADGAKSAIPGVLLAEVFKTKFKNKNARPPDINRRDAEGAKRRPLRRRVRGADQEIGVPGFRRCESSILGFGSRWPGRNEHVGAGNEARRARAVLVIRAAEKFAQMHFFEPDAAHVDQISSRSQIPMRERFPCARANANCSAISPA